MITLLVWGAALGGSLSELEAQLQQFPDDYATAVALGRAAVDAGDGELALRAWLRAAEVSGGNLESGQGAVLALTAVGRHAEAREAADALVEEYPDSPTVWSVHAWAWRWVPTLPHRSAWKATRSYETAIELGGGGDAQCGLGYTRRALGDGRGAREAFTASSSACGRRGLAETPDGWRAWASMAGGLTGYTEHVWRESGNHVGGQVGARWSDTVGVDLTARRVSTSGVRPPPKAREGKLGPPPVVDATVVQTEVWARVGARSGTAGGDVLVGSVSISGDDSGSALAAGGRAWMQVSPLTLGVSGVSTTYDDSAHLQLGVDLDLPISPSVSLGWGVDHTRLFSTTTVVDGTGQITEVELSDSGMSGWLLGRYWFAKPDVTLSVGGRMGREVSPVRLAQPAIWNLDEALLRSSFADIGWRVDGRFTFFGGVERVRLDSPPEESPLSPGESILTTGYVGLRVDLGPRPTEEP